MPLPVPSLWRRRRRLAATPAFGLGSVATALQPDGSFAYNQLEIRSPTEDLAELFPLERTYTEWTLSDFANGGVDLGGRFGADGPTLMQTCQDCHMPTVTAQGASGGPVRTDIKRRDLAGASAWVLEIPDGHAPPHRGVARRS